MKLYNKIQELLKHLEQQKSDNASTLEYAKGELSKFVAEVLENRVNEAKSDLHEELENEEVRIADKSEAKVLELFNQKADEIATKVANSFDKEQLKEQVVKQMQVLQGESLEALFSNYLNENSAHLLEINADNIKKDMAQSIEKIVKANSDTITQEVVQGLDFAFLKEQPQAFYEVIVNSIGEMIQAKLQQGFLEETFVNLGSDIYKRVVDLEDLRLSSYEAQLHLAQINANNEIIEFNNALKLQEAYTIAQMELESKAKLAKKAHELKALELDNQIALETKRKAAIAQGVLDDKVTKAKAYKTY